jgi:hypothetical protein
MECISASPGTSARNVLAANLFDRDLLLEKYTGKY